MQYWCNEDINSPQRPKSSMTGSQGGTIGKKWKLHEWCLVRGAQVFVGVTWGVVTGEWPLLLSLCFLGICYGVLPFHRLKKKEPVDDRRELPKLCTKLNLF